MNNKKAYIEDLNAVTCGSGCETVRRVWLPSDVLILPRTVWGLPLIIDDLLCARILLSVLKVDVYWYLSLVSLKDDGVCESNF